MRTQATQVFLQTLGVFGFPYYSDHTDLMRRIVPILPAAAQAAWRFVKNAELVGTVAPGIFANLIAVAAILQRKPIFFLIRGNKYKTLADIYGKTPRGLLMRFAMLSYSWFSELLIRLGTPAFVFGKKLYEERVGRGRRIEVLAPVLDPLFVAAEPQSAPDGQFRVLYVGRLSKEKGVGYLVEALATLNQQGFRNWRGILVGDGVERTSIQKLVAERGLTGQIQFAGHVPHDAHLKSYFENADAFVLPSLTEGVPHALLEAMGMRLPVVATSVGGIPGLLRHGSNGLLVPAEDSNALADALIELQRSPELRTRLTSAAWETAQEYTFHAQARIMTDTLIHWFPRVFAKTQQRHLHQHAI